jgi:hypothetical protein
MPNPLSGASFGASPLNPSLFGNPANPVPTNATATSTAVPNGNPGNLANPSSNLKDITRNAGFENVQEGQERNQLIPQFAQLMQQFAGPAGDYFKNLMNLGSPYYQQQQAASFNSGVNQNQNAAAQARQQLNAAGYGNTPSGATAAMIGGMNMQGSQNLAQAYLQNLFQNENLQSQGASGLSSLAGLFNPASLFGENTVSGTTQGPSAASQFQDVASGIGSAFTGGGNLTTAVKS